MIRADFDRAAARLNGETLGEWTLCLKAENDRHGCELAAICWKDQEIMTLDCHGARTEQWLIRWAVEIIKICTAYDLARMMDILGRQIQAAEHEAMQRALMRRH